MPSIRDVACRLLRVHPLRPADALQLAAALEVRGPSSRNTQFVCFDKRLALAARREGLFVP
jgi:predicted nucleic acid-binding protein